MSCAKEKTFADDIVLTFPKDTKMKTQEFNEDSNEGGENLIYNGKIKSNIDVKYYENLLSPPPPPRDKFESEKEYSSRIKKLEDSLLKEKNTFFRNEEFPFSYSKNNDSDSLSNKNLQIVVKENDTIPLYKKDFNTKIIKKYYAFPVFIKNISDKILRIPTESKSTALYIYDDNLDKFYFARNSNYMICGIVGGIYSYIELKPNEILIYSYPYFKSGTKRKAKMKFYKAYSKEFQISIDEKILKNQYNKYYE
ncbi:hypothetical protein ACFOWU_15465 [Epilithonimonas zeae]|uniref:Uncharacterized protein n=1 Tax=Epilithonimonas zeae TaxID=1416779 RepID=A0A1N6IFQ7_9FLAO|nr:hypothetical protein [Epilithonimonas zeae]SIO30821.1 hypothetical protein SAMN05444409_2614 [Epilithonimonas zeae]